MCSPLATRPPTHEVPDMRASDPDHAATITTECYRDSRGYSTGFTRYGAVCSCGFVWPASGYDHAREIARKHEKGADDMLRALRAERTLQTTCTTCGGAGHYCECCPLNAYL